MALPVPDLALVDRLLGLWRNPPVGDAAALAAFRALYTDPVDVNGTAIAAVDLLARARDLHRAYSDLHHELLDVVTAPGRVVVAFHLLGTHTGPLVSPVGTVAPTGRTVRTRTIDVLTVADGRITAVVVVGDDLGTLLALGAVDPAGG